MAGLPGQRRRRDPRVARALGGAAHLLGIAAAAVAGTIVVRRQLAPLREVAATAHRVAEKPLSEGEIDLSDRVPERLTDERNEVGQVGAALNSLLDHVETSLAVAAPQRAAGAPVRRRRQRTSCGPRSRPSPATPSWPGASPRARATALDKVEGGGRPDDRHWSRTCFCSPASTPAGRWPRARRPDAAADRGGQRRPVVAPDHTWRLALPDEPVEVVGDEQRLHQVVTNLLTNARKHTPAGTTVTVTAPAGRLRRARRRARVPAGVAEHAFERFVRGDAARHREGGVGLGLALVRRSSAPTVGPWPWTRDPEHDGRGHAAVR